MAPRAVWRGSISFWLVNIPVRMYTAVRAKRVSFHMLHDKDGVRLKEQFICPADKKVVERKDMVRGYDLGGDQYVVVRQEELDALAPKSSRILEIMDFIEQADIDPLYFATGHWLMPEENAVPAYRLLNEAMTASGKVGITKFVMAGREHLAVLRPVDSVFQLATLRYAEEVIGPEQFEELPPKVKVDKRQLEMAEQLIESMTVAFEPKKYRDEYDDAVRDMVKRKAKGLEIVTPPPVQEAKVIDLMSALEESLASARKKKGKKASA